MKPQKRIVVYLPEEDYRQLKSKLALLGLTISAWVRKLVKDRIKD